MSARTYIASDSPESGPQMCLFVCVFVKSWFSNINFFVFLFPPLKHNLCDRCGVDEFVVNCVFVGLMIISALLHHVTNCESVAVFEEWALFNSLYRLTVEVVSIATESNRSPQWAELMPLIIPLRKRKGILICLSFLVWAHHCL